MFSGCLILCLCHSVSESFKCIILLFVQRGFLLLCCFVMLRDPVLLKAHHLRGSSSNLKIAALSKFDSVVMNKAKKASSSYNYRPIALAPTLSKALEWCILLSYPDHFLTSGLQFGFKQKMSTTLCTGAVKNIASRYMHENSAVYACFLDASKAFDLVNHKILFEKIIHRNLPAYFIRFFLSWHKEQRMCVRWGNTLSDSFPVSNGVRQGGVLSPILFTI